MAQSIKKIYYAPDAFKLLKGVFCIYKPSELSLNAVKERITGVLCRDLNMMEVRPPENIVKIEEDSLSESGLTVVNVPSVADNPLVVGPRYQKEDFRVASVSRYGFHTSGLCVFSLNSSKKISDLMNARHLRVYQLCGKLGKATDTFHESGKVIEKSTYGHVTSNKMDRVLSSIQAAHQKHMFHYTGVDMKSQTAYEMASQGLIRPSIFTPPIIYGIRCTHLEPPNFTIEVQCINETESYLLDLINDVGLTLKTNAMTNKIRCTRYGNFTLDHALLRKHWGVEYVINNILQCEDLSKPDNVVPTSPNISSNPFDKDETSLLAY